MKTTIGMGSSYMVYNKRDNKKIMTQRDKFLKTVRDHIDRISYTNAAKTEKEKLQLLAFVILVMIDGESTEVPPFSLRPINDNGDEGRDIAGNLHNDLYKNIL